MKRRITICLMILCLPLQACHYLQEAVVPLQTYKKSLATEKKTLLVMFPGIADDEMAFKANGFEAVLQRHRSDVDMLAANVHLGYLLNDTFVERIEQDIIRPARQQGYRQLWLVGVSLGAFVALNYMKERPADVTGLVLLGPFLGEDKDINAIRQAGGISRWRPNDLAQVSRTLKLWYWYRQRLPADMQHIYLGYGEHDHLLAGIQQFEKLLPQQNIKTVNGGHSWKSWLPLWRQFVADGVFK